MNLAKIEGLTDKQKTSIIKEHNATIDVLKKNHDGLLAEVTKNTMDKKKDQEKAEADKLKNASSLDEMKTLLAERDVRQQQLEKQILDAEKTRLDTENSNTIGSFVDDFITKNVVSDSLVRDAIKAKISSRLGIRDGNIVEFSGSDLTGKTGDQVLSEIKADKGYSNHLVANNASGGGATGGGATGGGAIKTITRAEFESSPSMDIASFIRGGGNVVD